MIFKVVLLFCFIQNLCAENIGCINPDDSFYDSNANIGFFTGLVEGGSQCNQSGWSQNYIGINLEYYNSNQSLFDPSLFNHVSAQILASARTRPM